MVEASGVPVHKGRAHSVATLAQVAGEGDGGEKEGDEHPVHVTSKEVPQHLANGGVKRGAKRKRAAGGGAWWDAGS